MRIFWSEIRTANRLIAKEDCLATSATFNVLFFTLCSFIHLSVIRLFFRPISFEQNENGMEMKMKVESDRDWDGCELSSRSAVGTLLVAVRITRIAGVELQTVPWSPIARVGTVFIYTRSFSLWDEANRKKKKDAFLSPCVGLLHVTRSCLALDIQHEICCVVSSRYLVVLISLSNVSEVFRHISVTSGHFIWILDSVS